MHRLQLKTDRCSALGRGPGLQSPQRLSGIAAVDLTERNTYVMEAIDSCAFDVAGQITQIACDVGQDGRRKHVFLPC